MPLNPQNHRAVALKAFIFCLKMFCVAVAMLLNAAYAEIHGTVTGTTNYAWRMYSKSNRNPAIQGNLDYQHSSGFYLGTSVSSFDIGKSELEEDFVFPDSAALEITSYAGFSYKFADDWRADLQYSRYFYDGKIFGREEPDYNEFYLFLHYKDLLSAQVSYADSFYGLDGNSYFYELTGRYPLTDFLEFSSTFGYAQTKNVLDADYPYWNAGMTGRYKFVALDLRYYDAREIYFLDTFGGNVSPDHPATLKPTVVFSISVGF